MRPARGYTPTRTLALPRQQGPRCYGLGMDRRGALSVLGMSLVGLYEGQALGAVAKALTLPDLLKKSTSTLVIKAVAQRSSWVTMAGSQRIVTDTEARVEELVAGVDPSATQIMLRTLGGRVGNIGQIVEGEAELSVGETSLSFVTQFEPAIYAVTAMAQGHYPVVNQAGARMLVTNRVLPALLKRSGSAVERLAGKKLTDALAMVRAERR